ncbi:Prolyl oligopeptidase [Handroanthus impetiginosus]|uniref:Prolyl oligopeptidase n=1 Tax=Handroanthus impetiginosus TaxID=429701 RepID=A0A2G9IAS8_9LAMI|nr:Prolyl oligopeptidase [Handroanthus impetiginosus]
MMMKLAAPALASIPIAFFVLMLAVVSGGASAPRLLRLPESDSKKFLTKEEHWMNQTLDHFSPYDQRQFGQRYYEYLDEFQAPDGPIFLKICGESACSGITNDYIGVLAKKFGAAVVSLEHRYYGKSSPFKSLTTENLRYLSSKQALFDLAVFRQYYQDSLNAKHNTTTDNPWFVFGISYAGALSAWFRLKFPHLTCGSLASSAVVLAVYNFTEFDKQVGESAGPECKLVLQEITHLVDQRLESNDKALKALFGAARLKNDGDFLYFLADAAVMAFQYGNPDKLCTPLIEAKKAGEDLVVSIFQYNQFIIFALSKHDR